ncbi:hypothetical protein Q5P01_005786 [Channa striata]|uniref:HMA domain-containing protein n=1 Tax=Channa striata TaxID=64152 RepID=A0AA88T3E0_CHASR|nr:hypothetical protein Q5P01_005786 [Channa striata]
MFPSKSPVTRSKSVPKNPQGAGEQICMVECGCKPDCTCGIHSAGRRPCPQGIKENSTNNENQGFDNLAYEFGSQSELNSPAKPFSRVTFKLLGLASELQAKAVESRISSLNGVLGISLSLPRKLAKVDYDSSAVTIRDVALELHALGHRVESLVQIKVDGMHCQSCVQSIEGRIGELPGVSHIQVSLQDGAALIVVQPLLVTQQELRDKIKDMGFEATLFKEDPSGHDISYWQRDALNPSTQTVTIRIVGMTCNSCVQSIEGRMSQMTGVQAIAVSLEEEKGRITFDPSLTEPEKLRMSIEDMGFDASLEGPVKSIQSHEKSRPVSSGPSDLSHLQPPSRAGVSNGTGLPTNSASAHPTSPDIKLQKCFISIMGMTCASCVANIERNLLKHKGIICVLVSLMAGKAEVKYDSSLLDAAAVTCLIEDLGFGAKLMEDDAVTHGKLDLTIKGMTCASCVHNIESKLTTTKGILGASVALATQKAQIQFNPEMLGARDIIKLIQSLGFEASLVKTDFKNNLDHTEEIRQWKRSFLLSLVFGLPVMGLMIYMMVMDSQHQEHGAPCPGSRNCCRVSPSSTWSSSCSVHLCRSLEADTSTSRRIAL